MTDTRPTAAADDTGSASAGTEPTGLAGLIGTGDHKALGRLYIGTSLLFGILALTASAVSRFDQVGDGLLGPETSVALLSGSQLGLVFLVAVPLFVGLGLYLTPLQVGAATVAFPRAAALSYWTWLFGGLVTVAAFALDGGPGGTDQNMVELSYVGLGLVVTALLLGAVSIATTVAALRTEGMSLERVPLFSWGMLIAAGAWLLTFPVLVANLVILYLNASNALVPFTVVGDDPWPVIAWAALLPSVYVCAIPVLGAVGDIVPTITGVRQPYRGVVMTGMGAFGALSLGAWAQPAQGGEVWAEPLFIAVSLLIVIPVFACLGPWITSLIRGSGGVTGGLAIGLAGVIVLMFAALAGALFAIEPFQVQDVILPGDGVPVGALGQSDLVLGAAIAGGLAALWHWGAKITGGALSEGLGKLVGLLVAAGSLVWGLTLMIAGFQGRITGLEGATETMVMLSAAGAGLLALAVVAGLVALVGSARGGSAEADAWGTGQTLEWATTSPPPRGNFGALAPVRSPEPLLDGDPTAEEAS